ncbi:MAG: hypothetical protein GKR90_02425 [Pseudomonadales bacterium]|nr:hypothetical protein [Pseudomonadales bacterium]
MKYLAGIVALAAVILLGIYLNLDNAMTPLQGGPTTPQHENSIVEVDLEPVRTQPLRALNKQVDEPEAVDADTEGPVFYPDDEYMQLAAEHMMAEYRMSVEEVQTLSDLHVLLELVEPQYCEKYNGDVELFDCEDYHFQSPTLVHPYYDYPLEALESIANSDGVAAAVLAKRIGAKNVNKAREYAMRSAIITGKIGPLLLHQQDYAEVALKQYSAPIRLETGIEKGLPFAVAMYALDAVTSELGNPLPPLEPKYLEAAPVSIREAVEAHTEILKEEYRQIRRELALEDPA